MAKYEENYIEVLLSNFDETDQTNWWFLDVDDLSTDQKVRFAIERIEFLIEKAIGTLSYLGEGSGSDYFISYVVETSLDKLDIKRLAKMIVEKGSKG